MPNIIKNLILRLLRKSKYFFDRYRFKFLAVPGMMGYEERVNLFNVCKNELRGKGVAIEFGSFLGASTAAIQAGLAAGNSKEVEFHVVDCFKSAQSSDFSDLVRSYTKAASIDHLLVEDNEWLNFHKCFLNNIDENKLIVYPCFLKDFEWHSKPIEFLHLDMPKDWKLAFPISKIIFPDLVVGAKILFQDFGYQWSAELIAIIGIFTKKGLIKPYRITDTTLTAEVLKKITEKDIEDLNELMSSVTNVIDGIDSARQSCIYLSEQTDLTLLMARAQYLYMHGETRKAFHDISIILMKSNTIPNHRLADLFDKSFISDKSYEIIMN